MKQIYPSRPFSMCCVCILLVLEDVCACINHVTSCKDSQCSQFLANAVLIHIKPAVDVTAG